MYKNEKIGKDICIKFKGDVYGNAKLEEFSYAL